MYSSEKYINDQVQLNEFFLMTGIIAGLYSVIIWFIKILIVHLWWKFKPKKLNEKWTATIRKIVKDDKINVYEISGAPNAFCDGSSLYLTPVLLKHLNDREACAVLLHEYGHYKYKHMEKMKKRTFITIPLSNFLVAAAIVSVFGPISIGIAWMLSALTGATIDTWIFLSKDRSHELAADSFATEMGYKKELVSALKKLYVLMRKEWKKTFCDKREDRKTCQEKIQKVEEAMERMDAHPPLKKRIENILQNSRKRLESSNPNAALGFMQKVMGWFKKEQPTKESV